MSKKKGIGISMEFIVIAAIGLVVVFVVIWMFTGRVGSFRESTETCYSKGGECLSKIANSDDDRCESGSIVLFTKDCTFFPPGEDTKDRLGQCCVKT